MSDFQLRDYQADLVNKLSKNFAVGISSQILCLPTGGGKTFIFSEIARRIISNKRRVGIFTHRSEIMDQIIGSLGMMGVYPSVLAPGYKFQESLCTVSMVATFKSRVLGTKKRGPKMELPPFDYVIFDEAHNADFDPVIEKYRSLGTKVIGVTATPVRPGKKQESLIELYETIAQGIDIPDLVAKGSLCDCRTFSSKDAVDMKGVGKNSVGDYSTSQMFDKFNQARMYANVVDRYEKHAPGRKTIVFCVSIDHSIRTCEEFQSRGYSAAYIDSKNVTPFQRKEILKKFKTGEVQILVNCDILTAGFDEPSIQCVIFNRSTTSLALWLQANGRGSRPHPGKPDFICIDMGSNVKKLGVWNDARKWELTYKGKSTEGAAPVKECPVCEEILPACVMVCGCGHKFIVEKKKFVEEELVEIKRNRGGSVQLDYGHFKDKALEEGNTAQDGWSAWKSYQKNLNK